MKLRFSVRKHPKWIGYWCVWDREEDRIRGHVRSYKPDIQNQCKHFNSKKGAYA